MSGLLTSCDKYFGTKDLYKLLSISREAKNSELKKAYYKLSLEVHPDRVEDAEKENATKKFQILGKVYATLSDKETRSIYDESGEVDEDDLRHINKDWDQFWRLFKKINMTDIDNFAAAYRASKEELTDLEQAYVDGEGDMQYILENVLCCSQVDETRFELIIKDWISENKVPAFKKFTNQTTKQKRTRKRKADKEAEEAEHLRNELGMGDSQDSLMQMIAQRSEQRASQMDSFFDTLASKYAPKKGKKKSTK